VSLFGKQEKAPGGRFSDKKGQRHGQTGIESPEVSGAESWISWRFLSALRRLHVLSSAT
jgi:hypothetical protein